MLEKLQVIISGLEKVVEGKALKMADVATGLQQLSERLAAAVQDPTVTLADLVAQVGHGKRTSR